MHSNKAAEKEFFHPENLAEPHAMLAELRKESPASWVKTPEGQDIVLVTSYALVDEAAKRTDDFSSKTGHLLMPARGNEQVAALLAEVPMAPALILLSDNPEHKRYRALVNQALSQGRVANIAPRVELLVDELIDNFIEKGSVDLIAEFATLLPVYVIADILGWPRERRGEVLEWSDALIAIVSGIGGVEGQISAARTIVSFRRAVLALIRERRLSPSDDLVSGLIQSKAEGFEPLTDEEIAPMIVEMTVAGNETTRNMLTSGLARLIKNPEQLAALRGDPSLVPNAVEELLRFETVATANWRIATRDTKLGDLEIPEGSVLFLRFDGGNRDPAKFEQPDTFDITRKNARAHQAFGAGTMHRCLGQMLARKELTIAFTRLLDRLHQLEIDSSGSDTSYWPGTMHRGIRALQLSFLPGRKLH